MNIGYFTSGKLQAFEALMQETPGSDHYDSGADGILPECRSCRFHRPGWKTKPVCTMNVPTAWSRFLHGVLRWTTSRSDKAKQTTNLR